MSPGANGAAPPNSGRKRKLSELKSEESPATSPLPERSPHRDHKSPLKNVSIDDNLQFDVQCPVVQNKVSKRPETDDVFESIQDCTAHHLPDVTYSVSPGGVWNSMSHYKHCKSKMKAAKDFPFSGMRSQLANA